MNYAIKINALVDSLWSQPYNPTDINTIELSIHTFDSILRTVTMNELYQILELCSQKALLMILQKGDILIQNFIANKKCFLMQVNNFFMTWLHPQFDYNLKRSYDEGFVEIHNERSISRFLGRILKEITKSNSYHDWEIVSNYLMNLGEKSKYFQLLVMSGYFEQIEEMQSEYQDYELMREFFRNFEYEIISKVIKLAIENVACCKQTLELLEIEQLQMELTISHGESMNIKGRLIDNSESILLNSGKVKYLKYNFELIKKIINFNYELYIGENHQQEEELGKQYDPNHFQISNYDQTKNYNKLSSFPEYIIKPILQDVFLEELYEIAILLLSFTCDRTKNRFSFAEIILELINKIIKTKITGFQKELKEKFVREILTGQTKLMKTTLKNGLDPNVLLKLLKGNLKILKNTYLIDLIEFKQVHQWLLQCFKVVQLVLNAEKNLSLENYLAYKAMFLGKEIVYQTIMYRLSLIRADIACEIISFGLKIQENFLTKFLTDSDSSNHHNFIVQCYSLEDLKEKRDRYFLNLKILSQIYLLTFNKLLKQIMININSIEKASKFLLFMSYIAKSELMDEVSFYYLCKHEDVKDFKKLAIGNCFILAKEMINQLTSDSVKKYQMQDVIYLYIERVLHEHLEHNIEIKTNLSPCDIYIRTQNPMHPELVSHSRLLTAYFTWILKIIRIKVEKQRNLADVEPYFKGFLTYLKILVQNNQMEEIFEIVTIQCELMRELIEFRNACRHFMPSETRTFLSQISIILHQEPQITIEQSQFKSKLIVSEIKGLLETLKSNPDDWMGICYEMAGFLKAIDEEKTYMQVIEALGVGFVEKICLSCIDSPNEQKIKLFVCFTNSLINLNIEIKINNVRLWFVYLKPIFMACAECFKIMSMSSFKEQGWNYHSYTFLENLLTNRNLNFYLLQRFSDLKQVFNDFTQQMISFLNFCLDQRINSYQQKDVKLFRVIKILFKDFHEYFFVEQNKQKYKGFYTLISKLVLFAINKLKSINNRKSVTARCAIHSIRAIKTIFDEMTNSPINGKFYHKSFQSNISTFIVMEKSSFKELQKEMDLVRNALDKCMRYSAEKVKNSDLELLESLSLSIYQIYKQKQSSSTKDSIEEDTGEQILMEMKHLEVEFAVHFELQNQNNEIQIDY